MIVSICDDDPAVREQLEIITREYCPTAGIIQFGDASTVLQHMEKDGKIDILLLDIDLGEGADGMHLAGSIRELSNDGINEMFSHPLIIFVTGYPERMKEAFAVHAFDFIVKPIDESEMRDVLKKATEYVQCYQKNMSKERKISLQIAGRTILVRTNEITYAESMGRKIILHTRERDIECYGKLSEINGELGDSFCRIHRSYIVNLQYVDDYGRTKVTLRGGKAVPMSKDKYRVFIDAYLSFGGSL